MRSSWFLSSLLFALASLPSPLPPSSPFPLPFLPALSLSTAPPQPPPGLNLAAASTEHCSLGTFPLISC